VKAEPIYAGRYVIEIPERVEVLPKSIDKVVCKHCNNPKHKFRLVRPFQFNSVCHYAVYQEGMTVWLPDGEYTNLPQAEEGKS
jgi:hypothetical protein